MLVLRDFRKKCEDIINNSGLPIDAVYYILKDIFEEVTNIYNQEMIKEDENKKKEEERLDGDKKS